MTSNNHMHSDSKKRRSFIALLFAADDVECCVIITTNNIILKIREAIMIVQNVRIGKSKSENLPIREDKKIDVGSAESDIRYKEMLVNGRHR